VSKNPHGAGFDKQYILCMGEGDWHSPRARSSFTAWDARNSTDVDTTLTVVLGMLEAYACASTTPAPRVAHVGNVHYETVGIRNG
jgi:hypothetical protein